MANTNAYIDRIQVPNGSNTITNYLVDNVSGYSKTLVIHLAAVGGSFQSDVSYNEILAAYEDGKNLIVLDESELLQESTLIFAPLTSYVDYAFHFERLASRNSTLNTSGIGSYYKYSISPGNAPSTSALVTGTEVRGVPFASSSNNGKILKVVNGNWELANESAGGSTTIRR